MNTRHSLHRRSIRGKPLDAFLIIGRDFDHSIIDFSPSYIPEEVANIAEDSTEYEFDTAIYYGDSAVGLGEPFAITCIIPITDPIFWLKDGEPIVRHNLRHGRDEHSYVLSETPIEGEYITLSEGQRKEIGGNLRIKQRTKMLRIGKLHLNPNIHPCVGIILAIK